MKPKTTFFFTFLCACQTVLFTQNTRSDTTIQSDMPIAIVIDRHLVYTNIADKIDYYHDVSTGMDIQTLIGKHDVWINKKSGSSNLQLSPEGSYWIRFRVHNSDFLATWIDIIFSSHEIHKARIFRSFKGRIDSSHWSGSSIPLHLRPTFNSNIGFSEPLPANSLVTFYLYAECKQMPVQTTLVVRNPVNEEMKNILKKMDNYIGFATGLIFTYGLFALLLILFFPIPLHFWYAIYVVGGILYQFAATGLGGENIWTNWLVFNRVSAETMGTVCLIGFLMMARLALNIDREHKWVNRLILCAALIGGLFILTSLCVGNISQKMYVSIALLCGFNGLASLLGVFGVAFWQYFIKHKTKSGWFLLLFSIFFAGTCVLMLSEIGWIEKSEFILRNLTILLIFSEVTFTSLYIVKNLYDILINRERDILEAQAQHLAEMMRISADLHDEMGSTLSSISFLSQVAVNNLPSEADKKRYEVIGTRTRDVMDTLSDIVWNVNPNNDTLPQTVERMKGFAAEALESQQIKLQFFFDTRIQNALLPIVQRKNVYLIFKEAVNNIAKHAQATVVFVEISYKCPFFLMTIKDNGQGFDAEVVKMGNGLKNMHKRAEKIGGKLDLQSTLNEGTTLTVSVPVT